MINLHSHLVFGTVISLTILLFHKIITSIIINEITRLTVHLDVSSLSLSLSSSLLLNITLSRLTIPVTKILQANAL